MKRLSVIVALLLVAQATDLSEWCVSGIIAFGGSLTDTGNSVKLLPGFYDQGNPPYGITFPGYPTGRCSDGKLVLDFFGDALGMQQVPANSSSSEHPLVNFAYAGASAANRTWRNPMFLLRQITIFQQHISATWPYQEFLFWFEIGRNDIQLELEYGNKTIDEIRSISIPAAMQSIRTALRTLHSYGARKFLIQSTTPLGCSPLFKVLFRSTFANDYDKHNCLIKYNDLAILFNKHLLRTIRTLELQIPDANFVYADAYTPLIRILEKPSSFGFKNVEDACCGSGGSYNFNPSSKCGRGGKGCNKPEEYVFWDGQHFTQQYYSVIAAMYLSGQHIHRPVNILTCRQRFQV